LSQQFLFAVCLCDQLWSVKNKPATYGGLLKQSCFPEKWKSIKLWELQPKT